MKEKKNQLVNNYTIADQSQCCLFWQSYLKKKKVNKRLLDYFESNDILFKHQYGFRNSSKFSLVN